MVAGRIGEVFVSRNIILVDPLPRTLDLIMEPGVRARLEALGEVVLSEDRPMDDAQVDELLPDTVLIFGQTSMPKERLDRAKKLKAIINVETNLLPNIDYQACTERGIWVITPASAFAAPVAESALGMAIDLCRNITAADRQFRTGTEGWGLGGNDGVFRFAGAPIGIVGFGDLGRQFRELARPFRNLVRVDGTDGDGADTCTGEAVRRFSTRSRPSRRAPSGGWHLRMSAPVSFDMTAFCCGAQKKRRPKAPLSTTKTLPAKARFSLAAQISGVMGLALTAWIQFICVSDNSASTAAPKLKISAKV